MNGGPGSTMAHYPTDKTRQLVKALTAYGIKQDDILRLVGVRTRDTLEKHYRDELDQGIAEANAKVAQNLFRIATSSEKGAVPAAIFWLKCRARWRSSEVDEMLTELELLRTKLAEAEERLSRIGAPRLIAS
jgi:hypothetical protein